MSAPEPAHIGDGVYASFDGFHLSIAVNDHRNHVVSLEPSVLRALVDYAQFVNDSHRTDHFKWASPRLVERIGT